MVTQALARLSEAQGIALKKLQVIIIPLDNVDHPISEAYNSRFTAKLNSGGQATMLVHDVILGILPIANRAPDPKMPLGVEEQSAAKKWR